MRPRTWLVVFASCTCLACRAAPAGPPFEPVADVKTLMEAVIDPSADIVWDATGSIVSATETVVRSPQTDEEWERVRYAAVLLAESGNLLMMPPRARDQDVWMARARELVETGTKALKAAEAKDADGLLTIGGEIYEACSNCHQLYIPEIVDAR